jgi:hypothetical protein
VFVVWLVVVLVFVLLYWSLEKKKSTLGATVLAHHMGFYLNIIMNET